MLFVVLELVERNGAVVSSVELIESDFEVVFFYFIGTALRE